MKEIKHTEPTFMVHCPKLGGPDDTGCRLVTGTQRLGTFVVAQLEALSENSKEKMRGLIEQDPSHIPEMFRGRRAITLYNKGESRSVDVFWIPAAAQ